jgi:hypothetical protein
MFFSFTIFLVGKKLEGKERMRGKENNSFVWLERNRWEKKKKRGELVSLKGLNPSFFFPPKLEGNKRREARELYTNHHFFFPFPLHFAKHSVNLPLIKLIGNSRFFLGFLFTFHLIYFLFLIFPLIFLK